MWILNEKTKTILRICEECKSLNSEWIKYWMQECRGKRPTQEKKGLFSHFRDRAVLRLTYSHKLGKLQAACPAGREKMNLLRYLDSIVDCNRATCSQRVYAKIFI